MRGCTPGIGTINWVWDHAMQDCPVRAYILEEWSGTISNSNAIQIQRDQSSKVSKEFLIDLLALAGTGHQCEIGKIFRTQRSQEKGCKFHRHMDDSDKCD